MRHKYIPVLAYTIDIDQVVESLKSEGVVVIVTTRTHAKEVALNVANELPINDDEDSGHRLDHRTFEVDDQGWIDCFMYSKLVNYDLDELRDITVLTVRNWVENGESDYHISKILYCPK